MRITRFGRRALYVGCSAIVAVAAAAGSAGAAPAAPDTGKPATSTMTQPDPQVRPPAAVTNPIPAAANAAADADNGLFQYADATENVVADGARGYFTIEKPIVAPGDHSLAEIAAVSFNKQQIIEVGWTVDPALNGDNDPHLFVYHWVDGQQTCYNGCGFVPGSDAAYRAGMKLPVTSTSVQFSILHHGTAWLIGYNGHNVGSFPDALWTNRFKAAPLWKWFGEVNSPTARTCTQMGNGQPASSPTAARIEKMGYWPSQITVEYGVTVTQPDAYSLLRTGSDSLRYGGPGSCRAVPDVVGKSRAVATSTITNAGFVPAGTAVTDPLCEDLNNVLSQSPAPGTRLLPGSVVSYTFGVPPRTGCPNL